MYDFFSLLGIDIHEYEILPDLRKSFKSTYTRYAAAPKEKKKEKLLTEKNLKINLKMYEPADMKRQGHSVSYTIDALKKYRFEVEDKGNLSILFSRETEVG